MNINEQTPLQRQLETVRQVEAQRMIEQIEAWMNQEERSDDVRRTT
jgi:hypothetical protein